MSEYNINQQFTLLERAKLCPDGKRAAAVLDVMDKRGCPDFLKDVPFFPANQGMQERVIRTTNRPTPTRRTFYKGVGPTITTTQVIYEPVILFEARSEIDEDEIDTIENGNEVRRMQDESKIKGLQDGVISAIFTDARTSGSEYIDGFGARLNRLSYPGHSTTSLPYVWNMSGSTALCSMWIVEWGRDACYGLYPGGSAAKGGPLGVDARNKGKEKVADSDDSTKTFYAYVSQFKQWMGLACANDWKVARIANIESAKASVLGFNEDLIIEAINHGKFDPGRTRIYVNPYLQTQIDIKAKDKNNTIWNFVDIFGKQVPAIRNIPIRVLDESILTNSESAVS